MKRLCIALTMLLSVAALVYGDSHEKSNKTGPEPGQKAPNFSLKNQEGKTVTLADLKGKIVVLEWFNYDCPFVKYHYENKKTMSELARKHKEKGVIWLAVNSTNYATQKTNKEYAEKHNINHAILDDSSGKVGKSYKTTNTPWRGIAATKINRIYSIKKYSSIL